MNDEHPKTAAGRSSGWSFDRYLAITGGTSMLVVVSSVIALVASLVGLIAELSPLPLLLLWAGLTFFTAFCFIPFMFTMLKDMVNGD